MLQYGTQNMQHTLLEKAARKTDHIGLFFLQMHDFQLGQVTRMHLKYTNHFELLRECSNM